HAVGIVRDISHRKKMEEELQRLSFQDGLTGVANRRLFEQTLDREWRRMTRNQSPLSLIMLDIDHFKAYNDTYGHQQGDWCLQQVAQQLKKSVKRPGDLAARYGGEEFAVILPHTGASGAMRLAEKIKDGVQQLDVPHEASPVAAHVTVSLGVAWRIPDDSAAPEDLVAAADSALYQAKAEGRNRVCGGW
ncbi:MAG: GGDEF domain-containing protein, partial [Desulfohalobiaceae bacterium]|nr:GGDEF domain-containing protein [Desulfohalobiaceae bacterium]